MIGIAFGTAIVTLTMSRSGVPPSLAEVGAHASQDVFSAFTHGVRISSTSLLGLALPILGVLILWAARAHRHDRARKIEGIREGNDGP